jgi:nucleoside-diphosphate-sugar epimerase
VARSVGLLCAASGHSGVIGVHVVLCARQRQHTIVTSDPQDIARIDPALPPIVV